MNLSNEICEHTDEIYETLTDNENTEQPDQAHDDSFYHYPENTTIAKPPATVMPEEPQENADYHTVEKNIHRPEIYTNNLALAFLLSWRIPMQRIPIFREFIRIRQQCQRNLKVVEFIIH